MRLDHALEWAASAHKRFGQDLPIDIRTICRAVKLYVRHEPLHEDTGGYLLRTPKRWYAVINSRFPEERQRWALAHELGEYMLVRQRERKGEQFPRGELRVYEPRKERFCDRFAANLLMPQSAVRAQSAEVHHSPGNSKVDVLAGRFAVSAQAMRLRLREIRSQ